MKREFGSSYPLHPIVVDHRDGTVNGNLGDRVVIKGGNVLIISAIVPIEDATITPGEGGGVSFGFDEILGIERRKSLMQRFFENFIRIF